MAAVLVGKARWWVMGGVGSTYSHSWGRVPLVPEEGYVEQCPVLSRCSEPFSSSLLIFISGLMSDSLNQEESGFFIGFQAGPCCFSPDKKSILC